MRKIEDTINLLSYFGLTPCGGHEVDGEIVEHYGMTFLTFGFIALNVVTPLFLVNFHGFHDFEEKTYSNLDKAGHIVMGSGFLMAGLALLAYAVIGIGLAVNKIIEGRYRKPGYDEIPLDIQKESVEVRNIRLVGGEDNTCSRYTRAILNHPHILAFCIFAAAATATTIGILVYPKFFLLLSGLNPELNNTAINCSNTNDMFY